MKHPSSTLLGLALLALTPAAAEAGVRAVGLDAITRAGVPIDLAAKFERGGFLLYHPDITDEAVTFEVAGHRVAARTDDDGVARATVRATGVGVVPFRAWLDDDPDEVATGRLWVLDPARPLAVIDIDGTLSDMHEALIPFVGHKAKTYPGAPALVRDLAADHQIVYLTARDDFFAAKTEAFLDRHRYPDAPVIYNDLGLDTPEERAQLRSKNHAGYKLAALQALADRGLTVALGIGNAETDAEAYEGAGIPSYIRTEERRPGPSFRFLSYASLRGRLEADGFLTTTRGLAGALGR